MAEALVIPDCVAVCTQIGVAMAAQDLAAAMRWLEAYVQLRQIQQEQWARMQALWLAQDCLFEELP